MAVFYYDIWKEEKFAKIRGDFFDAYFRISFNEARLYPIEDGYVLAGYFTTYKGIVRKFKPENAIEPGKCLIELHSKDYTVREKQPDGTYKDVLKKASKNEMAYCRAIEANKPLWIPEGKAIQGWLEFVPDDLFNMGNDERVFLEMHSEITHVEATSESEYEPPAKYRKSDKGSYRSYGLSPEDKMTFIKQQLIADLGNGDLTKETSLFDLLDMVKVKYPDFEVNFNTYLSLLTASVGG